MYLRLFQLRNPDLRHSRMASIKEVPFAAILDDPRASELLGEYEQECALPELGASSPQREMYAAMERSGLFTAFGAYMGDVMVGFAALLLYVLPHYGKKIANVESLFVAPAWRNTGTGSELVEAIERFAKREGCVAILYSAPAGSRLERLLGLKKPYRRSNSIFIRSL